MSRLPLISLWISTGLSVTASTATFIALPWFVLVTTGSATRVGVVTAAELLGLLAASAAGGPLVDRAGPRLTAITSDIAAAVVVGAVPILHLTVGLRFWQLVALAAALGASREPGQTARRVVLPDVVAHAGVSTERGAGGFDAGSRAGRMLGAPLAGAVLALAGTPTVLLVGVGVFLCSAGLVLGGTSRAVAGAGREGPDRSPSYFRELADGMRYLRDDRLMSAIIAMLLFTNMIDMAALAVFFPAHAARVLHSPVALGVMTGVLGAAALLGNLVYTWVGHRAGSRRRVFAAAFMLGEVPTHVVLALRPSLPVVLAVIAVAGLASGAVNPVLAVVSYQRIPADMRGRVLSLTTVVGQGATPLGVLLGGLLVDGIGLRATLWVTAGCLFAATLIPMVFPLWRRMDDPGTVRELHDSGENRNDPASHR